MNIPRTTYALLATFLTLAVHAAVPSGTEDGSAPTYSVNVLNRSWDSDPHGRPTGTAVLIDGDGKEVWSVPNIADVVGTADNNIVALVSGEHDLYVATPPLYPRRIAGSYLSAAISPSGSHLVAHRIGDHGHVIERIQRDDSGIVTIELGSDTTTPVVSGGTVFSPAWLDDRRIVFGAGAEDRSMGGLIASLFVADTGSGKVAQVTNTGSERVGFPERITPVDGTHLILLSGSTETKVALPAAEAFRSAADFSFVMPRIEGPPQNVYVGYVKLRRPNTSWANPVIYQYFDHAGRDWNCGGRRYPNHKGTDFAVVYNTNVVAGASGTVIYRYDGCPTFNSYGCGGGWGNYAAVRHADGTVSLEAHGVRWSVVVSNGQRVVCAQTLFRAGSSGNSNAVHVHHESWENSNGSWDPARRFDPFRGSCNPIPASKWAVQNGYLGNPGTGCTH